MRIGIAVYPDFVVPLARAVARGEVIRGLAICGSGVGACVAAKKKIIHPHPCKTYKLY
ncbi:MAG TPA: RpiB/LacA/LacB family sugar-phosphate isomerase [Desulfosporosinus sp.]|nr:RpiB/LacA/LacB family sugar-phosphate isomerase [Desulfosporosinus sp.]